MAKGTYIYLDRGILDHWTYKDKPFNRSMAWIDLLLIADHTTHTTIWRGKPTQFKRGDVNLSITQLAERWGWTRNKTRRFISALETDGMVNTKRTPERTIISIVKYSDFQDKRTPKRTPNGTPKRTSDGTPDGTYLINNKVINNEDKEMPAALLDERTPEEIEIDELYEKLESLSIDDPRRRDIFIRLGELEGDE